MSDVPFTFTIPLPNVIPSRVDNHIQRRLSALKNRRSQTAATASDVCARRVQVFSGDNKQSDRSENGT